MYIESSPQIFSAYMRQNKSHKTKSSSSPQVPFDTSIINEERNNPHNNPYDRIIGQMLITTCDIHDTRTHKAARKLTRRPYCRRAAPDLTLRHRRRRRRNRHHGGHVWCDDDGWRSFLDGRRVGGAYRTAAVAVVVRRHDAVVPRIRVIVTQLEGRRLARRTVQGLLGLPRVVGTHRSWWTEIGCVDTITVGNNIKKHMVKEHKSLMLHILNVVKVCAYLTQSKIWIHIINMNVPMLRK